MQWYVFVFFPGAASQPYEWQQQHTDHNYPLRINQRKPTSPQKLLDGVSLWLKIGGQAATLTKPNVGHYCAVRSKDRLCQALFCGEALWIPLCSVLMTPLYVLVGLTQQRLPIRLGRTAQGSGAGFVAMCQHFKGVQKLLCRNNKVILR